MITPNFKLDIIDENIVSLTFDTLKSQSLTLFRLSEFYESPFNSIRGKPFDVDIFLEQYMDDKGNISYFSFWDAYNIPGYSINQFGKLFQYMLTTREEELLHCLKKNINQDKPYYLISAIKGKKSDFMHELCHAKYYLNYEYKHKVLDVISQIPLYLYDEFKASLIDTGYSSDDTIIMDEINAYLSTSSKKFIRKNFVDDEEILYYQKILKLLFDEEKKSIRINTIF